MCLAHRQAFREGCHSNLLLCEAIFHLGHDLIDADGDCPIPGLFSPKRIVAIVLLRDNTTPTGTGTRFVHTKGNKATAFSD